jgi:hypothetical protein
MAIDLIDTSKFTFGTIPWQDAMRHNIQEKLNHREQLGPAEFCFVQVQHMHNINNDLYRCKK